MKSRKILSPVFWFRSNKQLVLHQRGSRSACLSSSFPGTTDSQRLEPQTGSACASNQALTVSVFLCVRIHEKQEGKAEPLLDVSEPFTRFSSRCGSVSRQTGVCEEHTASASLRLCVTHSTRCVRKEIVHKHVSIWSLFLLLWSPVQEET